MMSVDEYLNSYFCNKCERDCTCGDDYLEDYYEEGCRRSKEERECRNE